MELVNWGLSSFTAVLSKSGTVPATDTHTLTHSHTYTHTSATLFFLSVSAGIYEKNAESIFACVLLCAYLSVMDDDLVTGHM